MTRSALTEVLALGALTGMRSMAGPATLAMRYGGPIRKIAMALAAGEMLVDKMPFVGDRIAAAPLLGRAAMGALAGGLVAREARADPMAGAALGAAAAVASAHLAFRVRRGVPGLLGGLFEDAIVLAASARLMQRGGAQRGERNAGVRSCFLHDCPLFVASAGEDNGAKNKI